MKQSNNKTIIKENSITVTSFKNERITFPFYLLFISFLIGISYCIYISDILTFTNDKKFWVSSFINLALIYSSLVIPFYAFKYFKGRETFIMTNEKIIYRWKYGVLRSHKRISNIKINSIQRSRLSNDNPHKESKWLPTKYKAIVINYGKSKYNLIFGQTLTKDENQLVYDKCVELFHATEDI